MMKPGKEYFYSDISSFEDFQTEKERLKMKLKMTELRLNHSLAIITRVFSVSSMIISLAKDYIIPKISELLAGIVNKEEEKAS